MSKIDRRSYLKGSGAAAILTLAGCAGQDDDDDDNGSDGGDSDGGGGGDGGDGDGSDEGTATNGDNVEGPITIGHIIPVGHPNEAPISNGADLALKRIQNEGGLLGQELEYITADSKLETEGAVEAARRLVQQENVDLLMGPLASEWTLGVQQFVAGNEDIMYLDATAGTPALNQRVKNNPDQYGHWFTPVPRSPQVFRAAGINFERFTAPVAGTNVAVVAEDLTWNKNAADQVDQATSSEISVDSVRFAFDTEDFSTVLSQAEDTGANAIMGAISIGNGSGFISQWAQSEIPMAMDGFINAMNRSSFPDQVGEKAAHSVAGNIGGAEAPITELTLDFIESYRQNYDAFPGDFAWYVNDSIRIWSEAVKAAGTLDQDALINELRGGEYTGVVGNIELMGLDGEFPHGPVVQPDKVWYTHRQWQYNDENNLELVMLGPERWADYDGEHSFVLPEWMQ
jgi:branched-chain amino acid transport system substrate-binding protein